MKNFSGGYETHMPVLATCVAMTTGPVIEFGCGWFSTPMLHLMCRAMGRDLTTIESDKSWCDNFDWMRTVYKMEFGKPETMTKSGNHTLLSNNWDIVKGYPDHKRYGVAFIDYKPGEERKDIAAFMADKADLVICHDSEKDFGSGADYKYEEVTPLFKYVREFRLFRPYTLILSNTMDFPLSPEEEHWSPENV